MATDTAGKLYAHFAPAERHTLMLEALARGDDAEATRLKESCPRRNYTQADAAFADRRELALEVMLVACIDLRSMWAKLHMLEWTIGAARNLATWQQINAAMAFMDGERHGRALPQIRYFARHDRAEADSEPDADAGEAVDDEDGEEVEDDVGASGEFTRRMMAVEDRTQHATDVVLAPLLAAAASVAQDLVNVWTAYGRFCRSRLGVPPEVMMRAWEMPLLADVELMLKDYAAVRPQPEKVAEYADCCCATWDRRFGGPEGGDGQ